MKNCFFRYLTLGVLSTVALNGIVAPTWAQPAPQAAAPEEPKDTPLDIDPLAKLALQKLVERYKNLRSYSDVLTLENRAGVDWVAEEAWERPNKARVVRRKGTQVWRSVSDGTTLWAVVPEHADYYLKRPTETNRFFMAFNESDTGGPGTGFTQGDYGFTELQRDGLRVLRFQGDQKIDGVQTQLLTAKLESDDGGTFVITIYIGAEDGLVHQVEADYSGVGRGMHMVEKHTDIRLNPELPPDTWKFTPPAGLKPIEYYSSLDPHRFDPLYKVGDPLPAFEGIDLNGKKVSLDDIADGNKVVILHFISVHNAAYDAKRFNQLLKQYAPKGLAVVGIAMDARRSTVEQFVKENQVSYPVVFDGKGWNNAVTTKYGVHSAPMAFIIGRDGRLAFFGHAGTIEFEAILGKSLGVPELGAPPQ